MTKHMFNGAFMLGALAVLWVGAGFIGSHGLALAMTGIIGAVYVGGVFELRQFRQATSTLSAALAAIPESFTQLADWLDTVHPTLQNPVRLRIEGERIGLPGPTLTPYLVGLLVMLGMLGTFLGMVVTLNGAAFSLESTTDLQAIRAALAAPIKGLGLAFGTSVAGVAASAMLGLMSAMSRRERLLAAQLLDTKIATSLSGFSLTHQRQETYKALQFQARALPEVVDQMQVMMAQMTALSQQLNQRLLDNQESFHGEVKGIYRDLAVSVDQSLKDSLTQSARLAGESIQPVVEQAMGHVAEEARALQQHVGQSLQAFSQQFEQGSEALLRSVNAAYTKLQAEQAARDLQQQAAWRGALEIAARTMQQEWQQAGAQTLAQQQEICTTLTRTAQQITEHSQAQTSLTLAQITRLTDASEDLIRSRMTTEASWLQQQGDGLAQLASLLRTELGALRDDEAQRGHAAVARLGELQTAMTSHLTTLGTALEAPITRLIETASEAPRAAADVIAQLRREISGSVARDNALLEERSRIMATLNSLLEAIHHASVEQRSVIDSLVASSAVALKQAGSQFAEQVGQEANKLSEIAAQVTSSAVDVSSLSEAFGLAVNAFGQTNEKLMGHLQRIEAAMDKSMARSDDQLAYYVAQAREIIDLSLMSQKEIVEELRQLPARQARSGEEVS